MASSFKVKEKYIHYKKIMKAHKFIKETGVYIGIPQSESARENAENEKGVTNAELLFIHTNGSPVNNIPPRPVIEPALSDDKERIASMMGTALKYSLEGNKEKALKQLKKTGMRGQNVSRGWFVNPKNGWPPNSPSVIARKKLKVQLIQNL